jgi:lysophospholipase L1-like esterase
MLHSNRRRRGARPGGGVPATLLAQMPATPVGLWRMDQYSTSPRAFVPNDVDATATRKSLVGPGRRNFANASFWKANSITAITDSGATAPDGSGDATILNMASNGNLSPILASDGSTDLPNGTYKMGVNVRWRGTGTASFQLGNYPSQMTTFTPTTSWARYAVTVTVSGGTAFLIIFSPGAATDIEICDFEVFSGSADLGPEAVSSGIYFQKNTAATANPSTPVNGQLDLSNGNNIPFIQFPTGENMGSFSLLWNSKWVASSYNSAAQVVLANMSPPSNYTKFYTGLYGNGGLGGAMNGTNFFTNGTDADTVDSINRNTSTFCFTYDGATAKMYCNGQLLAQNSVAATAQTIADFFFNTYNNVGFSGYKYGALALYTRALSSSEATTGCNALTSYCSGLGAAQEPLRFVMFDGDSLTGINGLGSSSGAGGTPGWVRLTAKGASPIIRAADLAVSGSKISDLVSRAATVDSYLPASKNGRQYILHLFVGTNDIFALTIPDATLSADVTAITNSLATYIAARRAAGWDKIVVGTLLDRTNGTDGGTQFETAQSQFNGTVRGWVGTTIDAVSDFAANASLGAAGAANNATNFGDKIHLTTAGYALADPIARTAINPLWTY